MPLKALKDVKFFRGPFEPFGTSWDKLIDISMDKLGKL